jgi:ABC-2 type transport system permease protein
VGLAVTLVAMIFSHIQIHSLLITLSIAALTSVLFSLAGFINAIYAKSFDDISIIPTFVLTPLTYLGGIFYSVTMLSSFWQHVSLANPILYMVNAFRYGMLGVTDTHLLTSYLIILGFIVALFGFSLSLLNRGIGIRS